MPPPRLIFVTGKGGTGKSTVAAATALALARHRPSLLVDLEQCRSAARMLGLIPESATCPSASAAPADLTTMTLRPRAELEAFIARMVPIGAISRRMLKSRTFGYVTAALPGLEAFLMLERLRLLAGQAALEDRFVVIDAPATGHALELLAVARSLKQLAPSGMLNRLAHAVDEFLNDSNRFGVLLTLTPAELALREALAAVATMRNESGVSAITGVINCVPAALFSAADMMKVEALPEHAGLARRRRDLGHGAARARRELSRASVPVAELPLVFEQLTPTVLERLSGAIAPALGLAP
ncbi:MAG TPA: ArsA-related P-loop ATPase [Candidatus Binataceae bacterium]|nr:ArsA-related P-loop ATPase [Candidatus Binataceae bacterium]